jgi:topoisomerase-4 subunit B
MAGFATRIIVTITKQGSIVVDDDGRGIPTKVQASGVTGVEMALCKLHAGGKFGDGAYKVSGGLHGVGASVVNALSE